MIRGRRDELVDRGDRLGVDHRPAGHAVVESVADADVGHCGGEHARELVGDLLMHEEPVRCGAGLGRMSHLGHHCALDGCVEISIVEHDERRVATELHHRLEHPVRGPLEQDDTHFGRPGERHHPRRAMVDRRVEPRSRRQRRHDVDDTGWQTGLVQQLADPQRRERRLTWRLDHCGVAGGERRRELAGDHRRGEVPRGDDHHDADRWMVHHDPVRAGRRRAERTVDADRLLGVPAEELGGVRDLSTRISERLAVFERDQASEFIGVIDHQLPRSAQDLASFARSRRGPTRLGLGGGVARCGGVIGGPRRHRGDHLLVRRVLDVEALCARAVTPLATDQQLRLHTHIMHRDRPSRSPT